MKQHIKLFMTIALLLVSSQAAAEGMIENALTVFSELTGLAMSTVLKVAGLVGVIMTFAGFMGLRSDEGSRTTKGAAAGTILIGLVLMYLGFVTQGAGKELGFDQGASYNHQQPPAVMSIEQHFDESGNA